MSGDELEWISGNCSRWQDCSFADAAIRQARVGVTTSIIGVMAEESYQPRVLVGGPRSPLLSVPACAMLISGALQSFV